MQTKTNDDNICMIWSSNIGDIEDWKDWIKEEITENDRYVDKDDYAEKAWEKIEKADQEKYDNMPHKQYVAEHDAFIENYELRLTDEELETIIKENYDEIYNDIHEMNQEYLYDEIGYDTRSGHTKGNLDYCEEVKGTILCIGELGLWNGTRHVAEIIDGDSIVKCIKCRTRSAEDSEYFVEKDTGELKQYDHHHDGTNTFTYREVKTSVSDAELYNLINKIREGTATETDINKLTKTMGGYVLKLYGLETTKPKAETIDK